MVSSICTGFLIKPRILEKEKIKKEDLELKESTLDFLREAMQGVVKFGSAKTLSKLDDFDVRAKTGTAQTISLAKEKMSKKELEHAWLASYFSYKGEKPLTLVVLVEHVGTSAPARKIAYKFLRFYQRLREEELYDKE